MRRIFCIIMMLIFLSGCALSTIRPPKKRASQPVKKSVVERVKTVLEPKPVEKEEILQEEDIK